jgi:hypothetical protein
MHQRRKETSTSDFSFKGLGCSQALWHWKENQKKSDILIAQTKKPLYKSKGFLNPNRVF